jgi:hypothetical protein
LRGLALALREAARGALRDRVAPVGFGTPCHPRPVLRVEHDHLGRARRRWSDRGSPPRVLASLVGAPGHDHLVARIRGDVALAG